MAKQIHKTRRDQNIQETGVQLRTDDPITPNTGQYWYNNVEEKLKFRFTGQTKEVAFVGETAGQTLYSATVKNATELKSAVDSGLSNTIYLRSGTYDLRLLSSPGILMQKSMRLIGEKTGGTDGKKVKIITDGSHIISAQPIVTAITNNNTISLINNSKTVNLVGGTWPVDLTGRFLFVNGVPYLIDTNPTTTQLILKRAYTGPTNSSSPYYIASMIHTVVLENVEIIGADATHNGVVFRNVLRPVLKDSELHTEDDDTIYSGINFQYCFEPIVYQNRFSAYRVSFTNNNYEGFVLSNNFTSTLTMGLNASVLINSNAGITSLDTHFIISNNTFSGPAPSIDLDDASSNAITSNIINDAFNNPVNLNGNSNDNIINGNKITGVIGGGTLIEVNGDWNVITSNRLSKSNDFAISLTATAASNVVMSNKLTGGSIINDTVQANANRIEDDFSRLGQSPTGTTKDFIDRFNEIKIELQNQPSGLLQLNSAVNSGVVEESIVYWDTTNNEYQVAYSNDDTRYNAVGFAKKTGQDSGTIFLQGFIQLENTTNYLNSELFKTSNIGKTFYLGNSGQVIPEDHFLLSGVPTRPKALGNLIDVQGGGTKSHFNINIREDYKFGTPSNTFSLGENDNLSKSIISNSLYNGVDKITWNFYDRTWYVVADEFSGEITQPFNRVLMANSILDYTNGNLASATTNELTVYPHSAFINGYKYKDNTTTIITPFTSFSGDIFVYTNRTSGVIKTQNMLQDSTLICSVYNSGSLFAPETIKSVSQYGAMQYSPSTPTVLNGTAWTELAKVYMPYKSGVADFNVSASANAEVELQELFPYQVGQIKLQLNGSDIKNSNKLQSFQYVSGETIQSSFFEDLLVSSYSASGTLNEIVLYAKQEKGGSTAPLTFSNVNLSVKSV